MNISLSGLTLVLLSLSFFSCYSDISNALDNDAGPQAISVDNLRVTPLKYSNHFEEIEYIPLELVSDIPFGNAHNVGHYGDYYYVLDISKTIRLFIFDKKGQFINSVGDRGNGKGKFYELVDFSIEKMTGELYLLDRTGKINVYTPHGDFLREITITGPTSQLYNGIATVDESIFLDISYPQTSLADKNHMLREISLEGEFKNDWLDIDLVNKGASFSEYVTITKSLYATPNGVYYAKEFMDVIYKLESNSVEPFRTISSKYSLRMKTSLG
ncbi:hypothetical protein CEQ90_05545 [Lewinellaceae bacterium SD302]|nr:hypothetical protein CEQ90_05545 [Lewinellaceae bacterium SD302]